MLGICKATSASLHHAVKEKRNGAVREAVNQTTKFRANQYVKIEHQTEKMERRRFQSIEMNFF